MTSLQLSIAGAALAALMAVAVPEAEAQQGSSPSPFGARSEPPRAGYHHDRGNWGGRHHRRFRGGFYPGFIIVEREVPIVVEREVVVREVPVPAAAPAPPPEPRKPYVVGQSYASLPGGCMKMIEGAASYYYCGNDEWYRPVGKQYRAVARP